MRTIRFRDRTEAGKMLAERLEASTHHEDLVVLALPRGGVPVAIEVARALGAPLDIMVVRKMGVPGHEELAMGAIDARGDRVLNQHIIRQLRVSQSALDAVAAAERAEAERRERVYRAGQPALDVAHRTVVLVDDGLATGASMTAAISGTRAAGAAHVIVAVPVAAFEAADHMRRLADACVCVQEVDLSYGVGWFYEDFRQLTDDEVCELLRGARHQSTPHVVSG